MKTAGHKAVTGGFAVVEVPGIEPGSFADLSGLLRAQLARSLLGPTDHASESV
jgi:site-specific DNA recombinase